MSQPLGHRSLALIATLSASLAFAAEPTPETAAPAPATVAPAAASAPAAEPVPQIPGGSLATQSDALRANVLLDVIAYSRVTHGCTTPKVIDTRTRSPKGRVRISRDGKLLSGIVNETWKMEVCGTKRTYSVVLSPSVDGSSGVAISERE